MEGKKYDNGKLRWSLVPEGVIGSVYNWNPVYGGQYANLPAPPPPQSKS